MLLTRSLLNNKIAFNLHVLSVLLAFILGQDQTQVFKIYKKFLKQDKKRIKSFEKIFEIFSNLF